MSTEIPNIQITSPPEVEAVFQEALNIKENIFKRLVNTTGFTSQLTDQIYYLKFEEEPCYE